jgi:hypothetical protein
LNNITIDALSADPGLIISTDATPYLSHTTPNLSVGGFDVFPLFDIWTTEAQVLVGEDDVAKPITVGFDFSMPVSTGGPIVGETVGYVSHWGTVTYGVPGIYTEDVTDWLNDEGQVSWNAPANFTFGGDGLFSITLSPTSFSQGLISLDGENWSSLADNVGLSNISTVQATLHYIQAPTAVPVPPAVFLLGTGILGIAGIRRKLKK